MNEIIIFGLSTLWSVGSWATGTLASSVARNSPVWHLVMGCIIVLLFVATIIWTIDEEY